MEAMELAEMDARHVMHLGFIGEAYHPCVLPLEQLTPIIIAELTFGTHHRGRYLCVKVFDDPLWHKSVVYAAVEDKSGAVDRIFLYNANPKLSAQQIFPRGGVLVLSLIHI